MGKSSATASRAKDPQDDGSGPARSEDTKGVAGKTLPEWVAHIVNIGNKSGAMGDFMAAMTGRPLTKPQYARMAKIYKEYPDGIEALMAIVCFVAIKDLKGDPMDYLQRISDKKRGVKRESNEDRGFSRDEYVES